MQKDPVKEKARLAEANGGGVHKITVLLSEWLTGGEAAFAEMYSTVVLLE